MQELEFISNDPDENTSVKIPLETWKQLEPYYKRIQQFSNTYQYSQKTKKSKAKELEERSMRLLDQIFLKELDK